MLMRRQRLTKPGIVTGIDQKSRFRERLDHLGPEVAKGHVEDRVGDALPGCINEADGIADF
jgi:hypothetical protein